MFSLHTYSSSYFEVPVVYVFLRIQKELLLLLCFYFIFKTSITLNLSYRYLTMCVCSKFKNYSEQFDWKSFSECHCRKFSKGPKGAFSEKDLFTIYNAPSHGNRGVGDPFPFNITTRDASKP